MNNIEKGKLGETLAVKHLIKLEYQIVELNYRYRKFGEIDIIAINKNELCFVEVKTRLNDNYGDPIEAVNQIKARRIKKLAEIYLQINHKEDFNVRFDVIEVYIDKNSRRARVHLVENAF